MSDDSKVDVVGFIERHETHHADVYALIEENRQLRLQAEHGAEASKVLAELMRRTHKEGPVDGTGLGTSGLAIDMCAEVLLAHLDNTEAKNLVSFEIVKGGEKKAVITIQRPTGQTPIELLRAANIEIARLKAELEQARRDGAEEMRKRATAKVDVLCSSDVADAIRALPLDPPTP